MDNKTAQERLTKIIWCEGIWRLQGQESENWEGCGGETEEIDVFQMGRELKKMVDEEAELMLTLRKPILT